MARDTTRRPIMGQDRFRQLIPPTYTAPIPTNHPTQCAPPSTQVPDPWIHPITQPTRYPQPLEYTTHSSCAAITTHICTDYPYVYTIRLYRHTLHVCRPHTYPNRADLPRVHPTISSWIGAKCVVSRWPASHGRMTNS